VLWRSGQQSRQSACTFVTSAPAAVNAGLLPYFVNVDTDTWTFYAAAVRDALAHARCRYDVDQHHQQPAGRLGDEGCDHH